MDNDNDDYDNDDNDNDNDDDDDNELIRCYRFSLNSDRCVKIFLLEGYKVR